MSWHASRFLPRSWHRGHGELFWDLKLSALPLSLIHRGWRIMFRLCDEEVSPGCSLLPFLGVDATCWLLTWWTTTIDGVTWSGENRAQNISFWNQELKCVRSWLPRYFRYSIEAKTSQIHKDGRRYYRSFTNMFTCTLKVLQCLKKWKEKKRKNEKRNTMKHEEVGNIEEMVFVVFGIFLKQNEKIKKTHGY